MLQHEKTLGANSTQGFSESFLPVWLRRVSLTDFFGLVRLASFIAGWPVFRHFSAWPPFCREFSLREASETRAKWAGAFSSIDKMAYFVCRVSVTVRQLFAD